MNYEELLKLEDESQSCYSPSIVLNGEKVCRVLFSPKQVENGEVLANAFTQIIHDGMSVLRLEYDFENCLDITKKQLEKPGINEYAGYVIAEVSEIRKIMKDTYRMFYILDTATKPKIGHADIYSTRTSLDGIVLPKWIANHVRHKISEIFNKYSINN